MWTISKSVAYISFKVRKTRTNWTCLLILLEIYGKLRTIGPSPIKIRGNCLYLLNGGHPNCDILSSPVTTVLPRIKDFSIQEIMTYNQKWAIFLAGNEINGQ